MAVRFGIVKIIFSIAFLILLVQLIAVYHFSSRFPSQADGRIRRKTYDNSDYSKFEEDNDILPLMPANKENLEVRESPRVNVFYILPRFILLLSNQNLM